MVFSEYEYTRPELSKLKGQVKAGIRRMKNAPDYAAFKSAIAEVVTAYKHLLTAQTLVEIRHTIDTKDKFYEEEQKFFDSSMPKVMPVFLKYYKTLLESGFLPQYLDEFGQQIKNLAELELRRFDKKLILPMIRENKLRSEYQKLLASCEVELLGEKRNLPGITKLMQSPDREVRRQAYDAYAGFFEANEAKFDELYDKLVKLRHRMGKKMGYDSFIPLAYLNMGRTDYGPEDVAKFREQMARDLVPVCNALRAEQAKRIKLDALKFYDEAFLFPDGNATPIGDRAFMEGQALEMYQALSPETGEFFQFMCDRRLMDLETKPGKAAGGYCTFLPDYNAPFIFSNFNGTSGDVDVLTHEAGHAFQIYESSKEQPLAEYLSSSSEVNEIHSMSMEFFTYPWMEKFFGENTLKYKRLHTTEALTFVPYGVCVDEFQHRVYEKPDMTPSARKALWRELEKKYLPGRDYDGKSVFERGAFFFKQLHIFMYPFYYIDYTLASMGAFEFYGKMKENREAAWADYLNLCKLGGSRPYLELLKAANLRNPFAEGSVRHAIEPLVAFLESAKQ